MSDHESMALSSGNIPQYLDSDRSPSSFANLHIPAWLRPFLAIILAFFTAFFLMLSNVLIKKLDSVDPFSTNFICNLVMALITLPIVLGAKQPIFPPGCRILLLFRGFVACLSYVLLMFSLKHMPMGDANAIAASTPSIVVFLAWMILGETIVLNDLVNLILGAVAVLFITQPSQLFGSIDLERDSQYELSALLMILYCLSLSTGYISLRKLNDLPFTTILLVMGIVCTLFSFVGGFVMLDKFHLPQDALSWFWAISIGILLFLLEMTMTMACQMEPAGLVSILVQTLTVLLTVLVQLTFYQEYPNVLGYVGFALTFVVSINLTCRKFVETLGSDNVLHSFYDKLCCITWPTAGIFARGLRE